VIERHQKLGLTEWFVSGIPEYLKTFEDKTQKPTLLTGEYTPFNLLVKKSDEVWKLCGMIDFADSFAGDRIYDLIGPGVFLGAGNPLLIKSLVDGYGIKMSDELRFQLMSLHLLHRFSNFDRQVAAPENMGIFTIGDVQLAIWSMVDDEFNSDTVGEFSQARVNYLIERAKTDGAGHEPGCRQLVGIILLPKNPTSGNSTQNTIILVPRYKFPKCSVPDTDTDI
jgi:hypothetical protein